MKKVSFLVALVLLTVSFFSCKEKSVPSLIGEWKAHLTLKTELSSGTAENPTDAGFLYTKQNLTLAFSEGGIFTRKVVQSVDSVEIPGNEDENAAKDYFGQFFNKNLSFDGEYEQSADVLSLSVESVRSGDDEPLPYLEFFAKDPSIGDDELSLPYEFKDGFLFVDGVKYTKSE